MSDISNEARAKGMSCDDIADRARYLLREHGSNAGFEAAMETDAALERADFDAHMFWLRVAKLIDEIDRIDPKRMIQ